MPTPPAGDARPAAIAAALQAQRDGHVQVAIDAWRSVLLNDPGNAIAQANLATALRQSGDHAGAVSAFEAALRAEPGNAEIWFNFGNLHRDKGDLDDAETAYRRSIQLQPSMHQAHTNLALVLERRQRFDEAMTQHRLAIAACPGNVQSLLALARLAHAAGAFEESLRCFEAANAVRGGHPDTLLGMGVALKELGRTDEAVACWEQLLRHQPGFAAAHNNLGVLLRLMHKPHKALRHLREAVHVAPRDALACANLAHVLIDLGRIREAERIARGILDRDPEQAEGHLMVGFAQTYQGRIDEAVASFLEALRCRPDSALVVSNTLFASQYSAAMSDEAVLALHRRLADTIAPAGPRRDAWPGANAAGRPLRIGYLSPDFRAHPVSTFFEPILTHHDRARFIVHCYSTTHAPDATTARLKGLAAHWCDAHGWADRRLAEQIADDRIDVLVDLAGHTAQNRAAVLRARPAPVQALYIGYPGTSGLPEMDYLIADAIVCPPGSDALYSECVARLPGSLWCYGARPDAPAVAPAPHLRNGHVTFGSFNALQKMSASVYTTWAAILIAVPGSRLVLKSLAFADQVTGEVVQRRFERAGVDPARIDILPPSDGSTLLDQYARVDIALDPFPYNGGTTTCDALWMGVPVVSLAGRRFCTRMGASLLHSVGLDYLVADGTDAYVRAACLLAADSRRLCALRTDLRRRFTLTSLGDARRAAGDLEDAYCWMWSRWRSGAAAQAQPGASTMGRDNAG